MDDSSVIDQHRSARRRLDPSVARAMILDAAERLMSRDGYAAVSSRRVAAEAGLKPPLVHYYYPKTDDLLLAVYERSARLNEKRLGAALAAERPLRALWDMQIDPERAALAAEFIAMANHRKTIGAVISSNVERFRAMQVDVLSKVLEQMPETNRGKVDPMVAAMIFASVSYALVLEGQVGIIMGHAAVRAFIEATINCIEPPL